MGGGSARRASTRLSSRYSTAATTVARSSARARKTRDGIAAPAPEGPAPQPAHLRMFRPVGSRPFSLAGRRGTSPRPTADTALECPTRSSSVPELPLQQRIHESGVALALHLLHHLPDEEADEVLLPAAVLFHLARVRREHPVHGRLDGALVRDLGQAL